jgi:zinc protease
MARTSAIVVSAVWALGSIASMAQAPAGKVVPPPPKPFVMPAYTKTVLPNGLTVLMLEKREFPLISVDVVFKSGSVADPAGKEGVAVLTEQLLRKGTAKRTAAQFADDADFIGMTLGGAGGGRGGGGGDVSLDATSISAGFLAKDQATALDLLSDMLLHPAFPADEVAKSLSRAQDSVKSGKDNPQQAIQRYWAKFLFGANPYGRPPAGDEASLAAVTRDDILAFYKANYTPGNAILAISGDFDSNAMKATLEQTFGAWQGKAPAKVAIPAMRPEKGRRLLLVDKPDATQTYFVMGNIGLDATNPDRGPVSVVNTLYGGRFTSLFNTELRIKSGYSYGANSSFQEDREPGAFTMSTYTRNATTAPAMDKSIEVVTTAHTQGFTEAQLTSAKNTIAGELPPRLETAEQLATTMAHNELYGITREQFNANLAATQKTTLADEKRLLDTYFPSADNLVIVVIGKASEIQPLMSKYTSNITVKKISDPGY